MNWFDVFVLIVGLYCTISGFLSGLIKQLSTLAGLFVAAVTSDRISDIIYPFTGRIEQIPEYARVLLSYLLAFVLVILFFFIIAKMLEGIVNTFKMGILNSISGSVFSIAKWFVVISFLLNITVTLDQDRKLVSKKIESDSVSYRYVQRLAPEVMPHMHFEKLKKLLG